MNFRTTILLSIVLAGIGLYVVLTLPSSQPANQNALNPAPAQTRLIDLDPSQIQRVVIAPADGPSIVLNRSADGWWLSEPGAAPADVDKVNALVKSLSGLQSTAQIAADQKSAAGLDRPSYTVELTGAAGTTVTISFGNRQPIGGALDALVTGREKIDVVSNAIYQQLQQPASAYRKMKLVFVTPGQIQQVSIVRPDQPTVHLHKVAGQWKVFTTIGPTTASAIRAGGGDKAQFPLVQDITIALSRLTATTFVDGPQSLDALGLAHPALEVWFSTAPPGSPQTQPDAAPPVPAGHGATLLFGGPADRTQSDVYASIGGQIVTLPASTEEIFDKSALDLRDKDLLDIDPDTVTSVTFHVDRTPETKALGPNHAPRYDFTLECKDQSQLAASKPGPSTSPAPAESPWNIVSGMRVADAHNAQVLALLKILHPLTVQKYIDPPAPTTQPASTYVITVKTTTNRTEVIHITDPGGDSPLVGSYGDATFELDRALLAKINGPF